METFSALLALCEGNPPGTSRFPSQKPVTRSFDIFFDLRRNKRLSKQSRRRWFETPSRSLWLHCNEESENAWRIIQAELFRSKKSLVLESGRGSVLINKRPLQRFTKISRSTDNGNPYTYTSKHELYMKMVPDCYCICYQGSSCVWDQPMRDDVTM